MNGRKISRIYRLGLVVHDLLGLKPEYTQEVTPANFGRYLCRPDWLGFMLCMFVWAVLGLLLFLIPVSWVIGCAIWTVWLALGVVVAFRSSRKGLSVTVKDGIIKLATHKMWTSVRLDELDEVTRRSPEDYDDTESYLELKIKGGGTIRAYWDWSDGLGSLQEALKERDFPVHFTYTRP